MAHISRIVYLLLLPFIVNSLDNVCTRKLCECTTKGNKVKVDCRDRGLKDIYAQDQFPSDMTVLWVFCCRAVALEYRRTTSVLALITRLSNKLIYSQNSCTSTLRSCSNSLFACMRLFTFWIWSRTLFVWGKIKSSSLFNDLFTHVDSL